MLPRFERRLGRVRIDTVREEQAIFAHRTRLEAWVAVGELLRRMLAERNVDPAQVRALRWADEAAAELAGLPEPIAAHEAEGPRQAAADDGDAAERFYARLAQLASANFAAGQRPDPARSSPAEWLAWCLVTPAAGERSSGGVSTGTPV
jgi:hypothetical protein